jgi:hypothetical protein
MKTSREGLVMEVEQGSSRMAIAIATAKRPYYTLTIYHAMQCMCEKMVDCHYGGGLRR